MADGTMACAQCNTRHPWPGGCWPSSTFAVCWKCTAWDAARIHRTEVWNVSVVFFLLGIAAGVMGTSVWEWLR